MANGNEAFDSNELTYLLCRYDDDILGTNIRQVLLSTYNKQYKDLVRVVGDKIGVKYNYHMRDMFVDNLLKQDSLEFWDNHGKVFSLEYVDGKVILTNYKPIIETGLINGDNVMDIDDLYNLITYIKSLKGERISDSLYKIAINNTMGL